MIVGRLRGGEAKQLVVELLGVDELFAQILSVTVGGEAQQLIVKLLRIERLLTEALGITVAGRVAGLIVHHQGKLLIIEPLDIGAFVI